MAIRINVRSNFSSELRRLSELKDNLSNKIVARALNRVSDAVKTTAVREIAKTYNITQSKVRERISVRRAFARGQLSVVIAVQSKFGKRALNLISFGARKLKRGGVSVAIKRGARRRGGKAWFIVENHRTGGRFVARRTGKQRGDIQPVRTVDVGQMFTSRKLDAAMRRTIAERFAREFEQSFRYYTQVAAR